MPDNVSAGESLYDAWEKRDFAALADHLADDVSFTDAAGQPVKGREAVRDWYASWAGACPDSTAGATAVAASGDTVAFEGVYAGTNTGPFGPFAPTGRSVSMPWSNVLHFGPDGKVVRGSAYYDQLTMMIQLGHAEAPA